ncbi:hypothetical protein NXF25_021565 [Crotalus adamanteus]|uniref:Ig-like domain-containing protein n=1 Tax=Crotalus adamanteus TaxID=8729 RepID=A0AAW1B7V9_CROAD
MVTSPSNMEVIKMQLPSFEEVFTNRSAVLTCVVPLMNASANATFSWTMDGKPANNNSVTNEVFQESNHTSLMYGQLQVNLSEWTSTTQFTCSIQNGQGETEMKHFDRRNGTVRPPKVDLQHQSSSEDLNVTLLCIAKDFYPDEIFLKWEEENQELSFKGHDAHGMKYSWDCSLMGAAFCDIRNESEDEYSELEEANGVWNKVFTFIVLFIVAIFYGGLVTFIKERGKGREGKGREGKGREGKGREGKGREGKGREGKDWILSGNGCGEK